MAERDIVQNSILQLGQSQRDRTAAELDAGYAQVDERSTDRLLEVVRGVASLVRFHAYDPQTRTLVEKGDWRALLPDTGGSVDAYRESTRGDVPPHFALLLTFLELFRQPQGVANRITGRHLDFQYQDVLRLAPRDPIPDRAHLLVELKKGAAPTTIGPAQLFSAGKDATGVELRYAPVGETVINASRVDSLRTVLLDRSGRGTVRAGPVADSSDGMGGALPKDDPKWAPFGQGTPKRPAAEIGFAIASPLLRLAEGTRTITLRIRTSGADRSRLTPSALAAALEISLTGAKGWIDPATVSASLGADQLLTLTLTLAASSGAVVDYDPAVHGYAFAAQAPVVQVLLRGERSDIGYLDLASVVVQSVMLSVEVDGMTTFTAETDAGTVDPKKAFLPFGPEATAGSRLMLAAPEPLSKRLTRLTIHLQWKDLPSDLSTRYPWRGGWGNPTWTADVRMRDGTGAELAKTAAQLFETSDATRPHDIVLQRGFTPSSERPQLRQQLYALRFSGSALARLAAERRVSAAPRLAGSLTTPPAEVPGYLTITLNVSFLHAEYRQAYVAAVIAATKPNGTMPAMPEPYTPTLRGLTLGYAATTDEVPVSSGGVADLASADAQFFHVHPFGPSREQRYLREQAGAASKDITLVPALPVDGALLVGLTGVSANDSVSLLFQVAPGSADPDLPSQPIHWFSLCDNVWQPLGPEALVLDTTNGLLRSGIVRILVPAGATTTNTLLPAGRIWLQAGVARDVDAVGKLVGVTANAIEVRFADAGNDPAHLASPQPAGTIAKLVGGAAAVKSVAQPFASFGGAQREGDDAFRTRVAERLRHKDRCITPWDYERVVLQQFPEVHRVKCIPHARPDAWMAPGHVLVVVVPDLRNRNAVDVLRPRVDADTCHRIAAALQARTGGQVGVHVKNPSYRTVRLHFAVKFAPGQDVNQSLARLQQDVIEMLSPWAFRSAIELTFGGAIYRSTILYHVEQLPYVDYVTAFELTSDGGPDVAELRPDTPDAILVSDASHTITPIG